MSETRVTYDLHRDGLYIALDLARASSDGCFCGSDLVKPLEVDRLLADGSGPVWFTWTGSRDDALYTAITGNGPTSEANARFYAHARDIVLALGGEVERLRTVIRTGGIDPKEGLPVPVAQPDVDDFTVAALWIEQAAEQGVIGHFRQDAARASLAALLASQRARSEREAAAGVATRCTIAGLVGGES